MKHCRDEEAVRLLGKGLCDRHWGDYCDGKITKQEVGIE